MTDAYGVAVWNRRRNDNTQHASSHARVSCTQIRQIHTHKSHTPMVYSHKTYIRSLCLIDMLHRVHSDTFHSSLKLFFLAMSESGAVLSSDLKRRYINLCNE